MKHRFIGSVLSFGMVFCTAGLLSAQTIQVNQNNRTIAVTATDKAVAEADIATVHIGFQQYAPTAEAAYASGSRISNAVVAALKQAGVDDKAIESQGQNLYQNTQFNDKDSDEERAKKQFSLAQSWTVKTTAEDAAKVLHIAVEAGANSSGQIDWDLKNREALRTQAADKALAHARARADQIAKGLNTHLGALVYASNREPEASGFGFSGGYVAGAAGGILEDRKAIALAIRPQKIEESATVYAVFAIE